MHNHSASSMHALQLETVPSSLTGAQRICTVSDPEPTSSIKKKVPMMRLAANLASLCDIKEAIHAREKKNDRDYLKYMTTRQDTPFLPGPAFSLLANFMKQNTPEAKYVSLSILSYLSKPTANRVRATLEFHSIPQSAFAQGKIIESPHQRIVTANLDHHDFDLLISTKKADVISALSYNIPAGHVITGLGANYDLNMPLHMAFDFDRCAAITLGRVGEKDYEYDEPSYSQKMVKSPGDEEGQDKVRARELDLSDIAGHPGPVGQTFIKCCQLRDLKQLESGMKVSIVTARTKGSLNRVRTTLDQWGVIVDDLISTGWEEKGIVLNKIGASGFLDDGKGHINSAKKFSPQTVAMHVPWNDAQRPSVAQFYAEMHRLQALKAA